MISWLLLECFVSRSVLDVAGRLFEFDADALSRGRIVWPVVAEIVSHSVRPIDMKL